MTEGEEPIVSLLTDKDSACMFSCFQEKVVFFYPLQDHGVCVCVQLNHGSSGLVFFCFFF